MFRNIKDIIHIKQGIKKVCLAWIMCCLVSSAFAQEVTVKREQKRDAMHIRFRVSRNIIDPRYMNNADSLKRIVEWVDKAKRDSMLDLISVEFCGAVSPEGSVRFNRWLSNARLEALEKYVRNLIDIPEDIIVRNDHYIAWSELDEMVSNSDMSNKDEILAIIRSENTSTGEQLDSRIDALKKLDNEVTWWKLYHTYFKHMRNAYTVLVTQKSDLALQHERMMQPIKPVVNLNRPMPEMPIILANPITQPDTRYMYIKTNLVGLGMLMANLGVEFDLGNKFSFVLPVYYSAINYFKPTLKFRTFAVQPEFRYWLKDNKDGFFVGAHAGFAYYNFAFDGKWRYQDKDGKTPTLGGGLSAGYRMPISKDENWKLEFAVGAGVYPLHYDVFHNEENGQLYDIRKKTYFGLDNVLIGISYRIPVKKVQPKIK